MWHELPPSEKDEIERFLKKFDTNGDGRISSDEIQNFLKRHGKWFSGWKARGAMKANDLNHNAYIDAPGEIDAFIKYAKENWKGILGAAC